MIPDYKSETSPGKYADEEDVYGVNWAPHLAEDETVTSCDVTSTGTLTVSQQNQDGAITLVKVGGGSPLESKPRVQFLATTSAGRKLGFNLYIPILNR